MKEELREITLAPFYYVCAEVNNDSIFNLLFSLILASAWRITYLCAIAIAKTSSNNPIPIIAAISGIKSIVNT